MVKKNRRLIMALTRGSEKTKVSLKKYLLSCAIIGPIVLSLGWLSPELFMSSVHTDFGIIGGIPGMVTNPISGLGVGPYALPFNMAFMLSGILIIIGILGLFYTFPNKNRPVIHWIVALLLMLSPVGLICAGIFTLKVSVPLHMMAFTLAGGTPVISFIITGIYFWRVYDWKKIGMVLIIGGPLTLLLTSIFMFITYDIELIASGGGIAGITSRMLTIEVCFYYFAIGWVGLKQLGRKNK
jgi:hypothetical membrane protein